MIGYRGKPELREAFILATIPSGFKPWHENQTYFFLCGLVAGVSDVVHESSTTVIISSHCIHSTGVTVATSSSSAIPAFKIILAGIIFLSSDTLTMSLDQEKSYRIHILRSFFLQVIDKINCGLSEKIYSLGFSGLRRYRTANELRVCEMMPDEIF